MGCVRHGEGCGVHALPFFSLPFFLQSVCSTPKKTVQPMDTFSKARDGIFVLLIAVIGFFLSGIFADLKEMRGDITTIKEDMREVQTRVSILEHISGKLSLATVPDSPKVASPRHETEYSGGHSADTIRKRGQDKQSTSIRMSNTGDYGGGSSGGLYRLCQYKEGHKGAPVPASDEDDIPMEAIISVLQWLIPLSIGGKIAHASRRKWLPFILSKFTRPPNL